MGEKPEQIERHIEETRNELGENLSELQDKVKNAVDWRAQVRERPMTMIGIAFGGGVLLSTVLGGRSRSGRWSDDYWAKPDRQSTSPSATTFESQSNEFNQSKQKGSNIWENIKGALVGFTATKVSEYLDQVVPGFQEHYKKVATERASRANGHEQSMPNVVM